MQRCLIAQGTALKNRPFLLAKKTAMLRIETIRAQTKNFCTYPCTNTSATTSGSIQAR